ncbi:PTS sugar transporter subunit IIA [Brachybacterium phenoliresistens]|uniref:Ascorbate-specific PTS system EIIA component n=1 Tax=Brachybacterium phenoliresistens TaxID=396014 RepID=Z9JWN4_9MICO|nr:PTS sugar transporter subunit IIA [Brachybacterium phenoliresistens]EWS82574.1 PTS sugar transporter subunit IIA [Brachybacterium phenoliresistens]
MLDDTLREDRVLFASHDSWRTAVEAAAAPLLEDGSITPGYLEQVLTNIAAPGGTYMDLGFGIALAHARPEAGVHATGLSLLVLPEPVALADDPAHPVSLVFVLAATDGEEHRAVMAQLARLLVNATARAELAAARTYQDVRGAIAHAA